MGDSRTTAYILISDEVKITTAAGDRTQCDVASPGTNLTVGAEFRSGRPYLASVRAVTATDALIDRSTALDRLTHGDSCLS